MKKIILSLTLLVLVFACKNKEKQSSPDETKEPEKQPVVYVSNYPLYYFASEIGGDAIDLRFPASDETDPSDWVPGAENIVKMQEADIILLNGATFEKWLNNVTLKNEDMVNTTEGMQDKMLPLGEKFTHSHGEGGEHTHEGTASITWLDLSLAIAQAEKVNEALKKEAPGKGEDFQANFEKLKNSLSELHKNYQNLEIDPEKVQLIYSHPVYQYLQNAYGLKGENLHWETSDGWDKDKKHEIEHLAKKGKKTYLVWEDEPSKAMRKGLEEMGVTSVVVNPLFGQPENLDMQEVLFKNLQSLQKISE
ncbi:zinc transport system substrate-binding protein [Christiangramia gaetbulicola]|uniref:Zinc transport system substrate-binding protein n=1 Tax=Christiangramia gaetbulicola TaxID=703340 RepID=A0A2T6AM07_9FLAO|nr:metal ABC transporter substrate-binding protein [Christiangramia gaetbulicola]PTX44863.1 zinc transport system substrate-binding protein [Christiangramia gaetbulicola]